MYNREETWSEAQIETLARTLKAIAHPTRLQIIGMLGGGRKMTVTEIYTELKADQSSVSHHLSIMRDRNVLGATRSGKNIYYFLRNQVYTTLLATLGGAPADRVTELEVQGISITSPLPNGHANGGNGFKHLKVS